MREAGRRGPGADTHCTAISLPVSRFLRAASRSADTSTMARLDAFNPARPANGVPPALAVAGSLAIVAFVATLVVAIAGIVRVVTGSGGAGGDFLSFLRGRLHRAARHDRRAVQRLGAVVRPARGLSRRARSSDGLPTAAVRRVVLRADLEAAVRGGVRAVVVRERGHAGGTRRRTRAAPGARAAVAEAHLPRRVRLLDACCREPGLRAGRFHHLRGAVRRLPAAAARSRGRGRRRAGGGAAEAAVSRRRRADAAVLAAVAHASGAVGRGCGAARAACAALASGRAGRQRALRVALSRRGRRPARQR